MTGQAADLDRVAAEWAVGNYVRRPDFDRRYFGHDFDDPHLTRDRSRTPVVLMRDLRRY